MNWVKEHSGIVFCIVFILLLAIVPLFAMNSDTDSSSSETGITQESEETLETENSYFQYTGSEDFSEDADFSISVPEGWTKAIGDGLVYFVHSPSGTSLTISVFSYDPYLLNMTSDMAESVLSESEKTLVSFSWQTNCSYLVTYQETSDNTVTDYIEYVMFDKNYAVSIVGAVRDEYYEEMGSVLLSLLDSFSWNMQDSIPEGYTFLYCEEGNFEYLIPNDWTIGQSDGTIYMQNGSIDCSISISAISSDVVYDGVTEEQYISYAGSDKTDFAVLSFQSGDNLIYAECSYTLSGETAYWVQYLLASGSYEYTLTFASMESSFSDNAETWLTVSSWFTAV